MAFPDLFKLEKLTIEGFSDRKRKQSVGSMEAMFNPSSIVQNYGVRYAKRSGSSLTQTAQFASVECATLDFQLLFDGTGVDAIGLAAPLGRLKTVAQRIETLMAICYTVNGNSHEPNFLKVKWGQLNRQLGDGGGFRGRLAKLQITHQSFNRNGSPLRAQLDLSIVADDDPDRQKATLALKSPDVTHAHLIASGDTLPLLSRDYYGSARHVAAVARANDLDQFRALRPGTELSFPPIALPATD